MHEIYYLFQRILHCHDTHLQSFLHFLFHVHDYLLIYLYEDQDFYLKLNHLFY